MEENFQAAFCRVFACRPDEFEARLFRKCLYPHAKLLAWFFWERREAVFKEDLRFIRAIATVSSSEVLNTEVGLFHGRTLRENGFLRRRLMIRMSGKKFRKLKRRVLATATAESEDGPD